MRKYFTFSIVSLALLLASLSATMLSVALPIVISDLEASLLLAGWVLSGYQLVAVSVMPVAAKLSESFGRKRIFLLCTLFFTAGSVLCAISPNAALLIAFRVIQAIGGAGFLPCAAGIVSDEFPEARERAIGLFTSILPIGAIVGPNLGGWMVTHLEWQSIFWLNVPLGVIILILANSLLKADKVEGKSRIDFVGAGLLTAFLATFMVALTELGNSDSEARYLLVSLFIFLSIIIFIAYLHWERKVTEPIIDFEVLRRGPFLAANIYNSVYGACAFGIFSLVPLYLVSVYGMSTLQSGLMLTPRSVSMMAASVVTSFSLIKWGYRRPMVVGTITIGAGLILLATELQGFSLSGINVGAPALILIIMLISGIGVGTSAPAANNACIELMPDRVATITGLRGMFRQMGGAVCINISTLVLHSFSNINDAFRIIFFSFGVVMFLSIFAIFAMPTRPSKRF